MATETFAAQLTILDGDGSISIVADGFLPVEVSSLSGQLTDMGAEDLISVGGGAEESFTLVASGLVQGNDEHPAIFLETESGLVLALATSGSENPTLPAGPSGIQVGAFDYQVPEEAAVVCFTAGTLISTSTGKRPVEGIEPGDMINCLDGETRRVRWVGQRTVSLPAIWARPILIQAGALGPDRPARDLLVSPQHRMLIQDWRAELMFGQPEVLIAAKDLVNETTIRTLGELAEVTYVHLLFDSHQIIYAEGAPSESFHPAVYSLSGFDTSTREELLELFPELECPDDYGPEARPSLKSHEAVSFLRMTRLGLHPHDNQMPRDRRSIVESHMDLLDRE